MERHHATRQVGTLSVHKTSSIQSLQQLFLRIELANALDQILVGVSIVGQDMSEPRNDVKAVGVVELPKSRLLDAGKFQAHESTARFQDAVGFSQGSIDVRHVAQSKRNRVQIVLRVGHVAQILGVALYKAQRFGLEYARPKFGNGSLFPDPQHFLVNVADRRLHQIVARTLGAFQGLRRLNKAKGNVSSTTRHVQYFVGRIGLTGRLGDAFHLGHVQQVVLPVALQAAAQNIVHKIVSISDLFEHMVYVIFLLINGHLLKAKVG